ncbi:hypothetical protein, partial [Parageobacillus thermoglucosidasius]|uniref:hypothetical protein n=1 Tax=Parageobacillus thermoglucosidasius TaxID=1426 RepID=UPI00241C7BE9
MTRFPFFFGYTPHVGGPLTYFGNCPAANRLSNNRQFFFLFLIALFSICNGIKEEVHYLHFLANNCNFIRT